MNVLERMERSVLKWFGNIEREEMLGKSYQANAEGNMGRGKPQRGWRDIIREMWSKVIEETNGKIRKLGS